MHISELIEQLQEIQNKFGDCEVDMGECPFDYKSIQHVHYDASYDTVLISCERK